MESVINVEPRTPSGKGAARRVRRQGKIPGTLYGHKAQPLSFSVGPTDLSKALAASGFGRNTVFRIKGLEREVLALMKDAQTDPVRRHMTHVDLLEIREDDEVVVPVTIELVGKPAGAVDGGILQPVRRELKVACRPLSIPKVIQVDVTSLNIGDAIHVRDVVFPPGTRGTEQGHLTVCTMVAPAAEEKAAEVAAVPAEGAAAAAPAEGAAAAAPAEEKKGKDKG